jgi:hypothetical protein
MSPNFCNYETRASIIAALEDLIRATKVEPCLASILSVSRSTAPLPIRVRCRIECNLSSG